jgi:hypothetical protein
MGMTLLGLRALPPSYAAATHRLMLALDTPLMLALTACPSSSYAAGASRASWGLASFSST